MKQALRRVLPFLVLFLPVLSLPLFGQNIRTESFRGRDVVAGEIIVRFRSGETPNVAGGAAPDIVAAEALTPARAFLLRSRSRNVNELLQEYSGRQDVLYAEPNYLWRKNELPNDTFFRFQWALNNTGQTIAGQVGVAGADIDAVPAWNIAQGGRSIVIGMVDSGFDYNHPDLAANIWSAPRAFTLNIGGQSITCAVGTHGFNAITRTCDPADDDGHGTQVAGIIGADGDNDLGISGVSRVASMMALKFLGSNGTGTTADAIAAIEFAVEAKQALGADANIRILNNSWGSDNFSQALLDAMNSAAASDMLLVASAGNDAISTDITPHYPSGYNVANIISIASTTSSDLLYSFSNFGLNSVDLGAPGQNIGSPLGPMTYLFEGQTGTSFAAAMVSGAAGLVLSACNLSTAQLKTALMNSVDPVPSLQGRTVSGGRLNVYNALVNCTGGAPQFTLKAQSSFVLPDTAGSATATITLSAPLGFLTDVNLSASAPAGFALTLGSDVVNASSPSTTLTLTADSSVSPGSYVIHVTGTGGGMSRTTGLVFMVGAPISPGQSFAKIWTQAASQPDRFRSTLPVGLADWYQVNVGSSTQLEISLNYAFSSSNSLRLLDSSGSILVTAGTPANNTLHISRAVAPGTYFIVASAASSMTYTLALNAPLLRSLSPTSAQQGATVQVQLGGTQFTSGLVVNAGNDIAVSNVVVNPNGLSASATFAISANALLGNRSVTVSTPSGTSNPLTFTVNQPGPVITSVTPPSGVVGTSVDISIVGSFFIDPTVTLSAQPGVTLDNIVVVNTTLITARINIAPNAVTQNTTIRVTTPGGFTTAVFQIVPMPPVLSSISPPSGSLGTIVDVTLTGQNFIGPLTINPGSGISVTNVSVSGGTTITARFNISPLTTLGIRNVTVTTSGGTSASLIFTVIPGPGPTLISLTPNTGPQTTTRTLDVRGTNFTTGLTFDAGPDIVVNAITIVSGIQATITLQIAGTAALGPRNVTITTPGGISNPIVFTVLPPPPTLTSISPSSGPQQSTANVTLTGTNFVPGLQVQGNPLNFSQVTVVDSTTATAVLAVPVNTQTMGHSIRVVTPSGTSGSVTFTVLPGVPTLALFQPSMVLRGRNNSVTLTGTNFALGNTTISPVPGVSIVVTSVAGGTLGASFNVSPAATLGTHSVTVTTPGGTTGAVTFTIVDPFPDLFVVSGNVPTLWAGLNGTYGISVGNRGTADATTPITVTDLLPPGLTFVSAAGAAFSCSASGQLVTCTLTSVPMTPLDFHTVVITVAIASNVPPLVTRTLTAHYAADLLPGDNTEVKQVSIQQPPTPTLTFFPLAVTAGQQAQVGVTIPAALPQDITGTVTLSFTSSATNPGNDPALQFSTGGRQVSFVIPANTFSARFGSSTIAAPIGYQTGTVAGTISFSGTAQIGTIQRTFPAAPNSFTIAAAPPVLQKIVRAGQPGVTILVTSMTTTRSVTELSLRFQTTQNVLPSCGAVAGCTVSGSTLTLDVKGLFDGWFSSDTQYGSLNTLGIPLTVEGSVHGSITVTLKNALGSSNEMAVSF